MLGRATLNTSQTSSSFLKSVENEVQKDINSVVADIAKTLNIHDFYSSHVLDYCEVCILKSELGGNQLSCSNIF